MASLTHAPRKGPDTPLWPQGKAFAFTVFDDCDFQTVDNVSPVYALLADLGVQTTKSVWMVDGVNTPLIGGTTCQDPGYRSWILQLQKQGFGIGLHNVAPGTSPREQTLAGFREFSDLFGHDPHTLANHGGCLESIYWGVDRLTGLNRLAYRTLLQVQRLIRRKSHPAVYGGHIPQSELFWGDLCQKHVRYVRNFVTEDINTLKDTPWLPYHDPHRPMVNAWYSSSDGANVTSYNALVSEANQDRLEAEGGACIAYTHFASGFAEGSRVDPTFARLMKRLAGKNGWFVPVDVLLDHLAARQGTHVLTTGERSRLEWSWLRRKLRVGGTN